MSVKFAARLTLIGTLLSLSLPLEAQFSSYSTGVDGPLDYSSQPPGTTIVFTPSAFGHTATQPVYNFTTINIPTGVTVRLSGALIAGPVVWLAQGAVQIGGTIDLTGGAGGCSGPNECRTPSVPGAGGYPGGVGSTGSTASPPEPGLGPGFGAAGTSASPMGKDGTFTGNSFLIPLVGGSGGGGSWANTGGGAGGGAIFIASSVSITLTGYINARGGNGYNSGSGSGGAIRLAAPTIGGNGQLGIASGGDSSLGATLGIARVESFNGASFPLNPGVGPEYIAAPYKTFLSTRPPATVSITSVNNLPVTQPPTGSFQTPDVMINSSGPVQLAIQAVNVPVSSVVNLQFYSDNGPDIFATSTALVGTLASSTATATVTFPTGYTRGFVYATFTGPAPNIRQQQANESRQ